MPVVNLLSDRAHPLQAIADVLAMEEVFGSLADRTVAWVGDYNNVARSLAEISLLLGMNVRLACPLGFGPGEAELERLHGLAEHSPGARYLHIATHGWFASETIASTYDASEPGERGGRVETSRAEAAKRGFAPETLCGLALAGANQGTSSSGRVPGLLTAEELATLDLSNCELAVLSACETNVGVQRAGQGVASLQRALHAAGARTVITSLWRVSDEATSELMVELYRRLWERGESKWGSLHGAKKALRDAGHPTANWAGWVLTGAPE